MIEKEQIAHDLAVAKLYGSNLQTEDLIKQYRQYKDEILSALNPNQGKSKLLKSVKALFDMFCRLASI